MSERKELSLNTARGVSLIASLLWIIINVVVIYIPTGDVFTGLFVGIIVAIVLYPTLVKQLHKKADS